MADDHLDKTTSVGAELTPTGLNFNAKSRFIAAFDRLCGNAVDLANVPIERRLRARTGITKSIEARFSLNHAHSSTRDVAIVYGRALSRDRAMIEADKQLIEGLTKLALDRMATDHEFAERVLRNHFGIAFDRQANKDGVTRSKTYVATPPQMMPVPSSIPYL